jgi:hypothetical protein
LHRKHELVKLCDLAQELDLEKITSTNDYEISQVNRRTITENGVTQVVCEIGQVSIWSSDIKLLPNIEHCDILIYLLKKCDWNDDRLKLYKKYNGYALFCAGHVSDVKLSLIPGTQSFYYILATCVPETRLKCRPLYSMADNWKVRQCCIWRLFLCCVSIWSQCVHMTM